MYAKGKGVLEDDREAVKWTRKAAEQGGASAQNNLGVMCQNGEGVPNTCLDDQPVFGASHQEPVEHHQ